MRSAADTKLSDLWLVQRRIRIYGKKEELDDLEGRLRETDEF